MTALPPALPPTAVPEPNPDYGDRVFDPAYALGRPALVEASAGTGKTYQIQNAYLRLVVADGRRVDRILVVTFTEAATRELRDRLRRILVDFDAFLHSRPLGKESDRSRFEQVVRLPIKIQPNEGKTPEDARKTRVKLALMDFDHASIFTLHGFCSRILDRYAFECGHDPDAELLSEDDELIRDRCRDWWRTHTYAHPEQAATVPFQHPRELQALVSDAMGRPDAKLRPAAVEREEPLQRLRTLQTALRTFRTRRISGDLSRLTPQKGKAFEGTLDALIDNLSRSFPSAGEAPAADSRSEWWRASYWAPWIRQAEKATWKRPAGLPEAAEKVWAECETIAEPLAGNSASGLEWAGKNRLRISGRTVDVSALRQRLTGDPAFRGWLDDPATPWRTTQGAAACREALDTLQRTANDVTRHHPAAAFLTCVRTVARTDRTRVLSDEERGLDRIMPTLPAAARAFREGLLSIQTRIVQDLTEAIRRHLRERRLLTYDQMLLSVRRALRDPDRSPRLREVLREDFEAALIDEFQDTDPVQYDIFHMIFADAASPKPLVFVGDPKQAIYGFRGGDIFTYYGARRSVDPARVHRLGTNYRSEPNLVAAVNALFADAPDADPDPAGSFLNPQIQYTPVAAQGLPEAERLTVHGETDPTPLRLWQYEMPESAGRAPGRNSPLARHVYAKVAEEIVRLLTPGTGIRRGGRALTPTDIAILVAAHSEADAFHQELARRNVPAVLQKTGNVFDTDEADTLLALMDALLAPSHAGAVRAVLCRDLIPCSPAELLRYRPDADEAAEPSPDASESGARAAGKTLDDWMDLFSHAGTLWKKHSFIEAFGYVEQEIGLRAHGIGLPDGERKLTHLLHLADLAHGAAQERKLGPEGLLRWMTQQAEETSREETEDHAVRLCSDESAVRIMTVFRSKGLQFPVVFVPTLWRRSAARRPGLATRPFAAYHDAQGAMILDLDRERRDALDIETRENLEENTRLVYVALTRAIHRAYLVGITAGDPDTYALQRLLARFDPARPPAHTRGERIELNPLADPEPTGWSPPSVARGDAKRPVEPNVDKRHGSASFSSLVLPEAGAAVASPGRDIDRTDTAPPESEPRPVDIFSIRGGARTGNCWHDLLETLDFTAGPNLVTAAVEQALDRTGICHDPVAEVERRQRGAVLDMIRNVLKTPIRTANAVFRLDQVPLPARRSELPFVFSLKQRHPPVTMRDIQSVLARHWSAPARDEGFLADLDTPSNELPLGFMTGYIDLLFCHEGRFYIADWKSNRITGRAADFDEPGLKQEMRRHGYYLQYMIYAVAVDAFLRRKLEGYRFDRHFGGVWYVFLRGADGITPRGFFHDPLSADLIGALSRVLARGPEGGES